MSLFLGKHEVKYLGMKGHGMCNLLSSSLGEREEKKNKAKVIKCYHLGNLVRMMKSLWELKKNFESEINQSKKRSLLVGM